MSRLDSEVWTCRGHGGTMIGRRPPDDLCPPCIDLAMTTEPAAVQPAGQQPDEDSGATHFNFTTPMAVLWPHELTIRVWVNSTSASKGVCLGHVEFGPIDVSLTCSAEGRRLAAAFTAVADELATVEDGTWSEKTEVPA